MKQSTFERARERKGLAHSLWRILPGLIGGLFFAGCGGGNELPEDPNRPLRLVATVGMLGDVLGVVAGEEVEVMTLISSGMDPHTYQPTRGDILKLDQADAIFYVGLHLEGRMGTILESMKNRGKRVAALGEFLEDAGNYPILYQENAPDPHLWMDPQAWKLVGLQLAGILSDLHPAGAEGFRQRAEQWAVKVEALDAYARKIFSSLPAERRLLITAHDAFAYLGRAYGIEVRGIQGISTESEAGLRDIENLLDLIVERGVPAVFVETSVSEKNVRALVEGARARGHNLKIGGTLFSDAMGADGTYEGTYLGMLDHNFTTLARALGGDAPTDGFQGLLKVAGDASTAQP
jgi:manganese/zinc/iron transport system substrate-binding protein